MKFRGDQVACLVSMLAVVACLVVGPKANNFMCFFLFLSVTALFMSLSAFFKNVALKYLCIILFSCTLSLAVLEMYFFVALTDSKIARYSAPSTAILSKNIQDTLDPQGTYTRTHFKRYFEWSGETIFDVTFTLDDLGRRITPYAPHAKTAVVLLGCSFTFGDGLTDEETFGYQLGKLLGAEYQVFNYGKSGSSSHSILEKLEQGMPELEQFSQILFYYFAIEDHLRRISGTALWDRRGAMYTIRDGQAVRTGIFADVVPLYRAESIIYWLKPSYLYAQLSGYVEKFVGLYLPHSASDERLKLQGAIMQSISNKTYVDYPQSTFTVMLWPPNIADDFAPLLQNIPHVDMERWFPNFRKNTEQYWIPHDGHPSAYANTLVAREMVRQVHKDIVAGR